MLKLIIILSLSKHLHDFIMVSENEIFRAFKNVSYLMKNLPVLRLHDSTSLVTSYETSSV